MKEFLHLIFLLAAIFFPFVAMIFMWRRMKRVRNQTYNNAKSAPGEAWQEEIQAEDNLSLVRKHDPNESLIAMGNKAEQARWPLDNQ